VWCLSLWLRIATPSEARALAESMSCWKLFGGKSQVTKAAEQWEAHAAEVAGTESIFHRLGKDLNEEARVKAVALARSQYDQQPTGGWIEKTGRKIDRTGFLEALFNLFFKPGQFDLFVLLALVSALLHMTLFGSWCYENLTNEATLEEIPALGWAATFANDVAVRLTTMFLAGHVLFLAAILHVFVAGEVIPLTPSYCLLMLVSVVIGGPTCAFAVSAHCEERARHKAVVALRHHERQSALADSMQWVYLIALAVVASVTTAAFGEPSLNPALVGFDVQHLVYFLVWPLDLVLRGSWLTQFHMIFVVDWVGIFIFGILHAVYSQAGDVEGEAPPPGLLGAPEGYDLFLRCVIVLVGAFPNPYLGLAFYLLLDTRHKALNPLLPDCTDSLLGNRAPRAMATWQARERGTNLL